MYITEIKVGLIKIPLKRPFKTALRQVNMVEDVIVQVVTNTGNIGYGEAAPTGVITGDTKLGIIGAIEEQIKKQLIGMEIENIEEIMSRLDKSVVRNTSAKAAVDIAVYDLYGQLYKSPVYKLLGGYRKEINTDITISVNEPEQMALDSIEAVKLGFKTLKIKVGNDAKKDIERMVEVRKAVGKDISLRLDANQGWTPKEAVNTIRKMEDANIGIELIEQPVAAGDIQGLKFVTDNTSLPVMADESVFSPKDAAKIMQIRAADYVNIKLMKCGGIHSALKIISFAEVYGVQCMLGCMLEGKVSVNAAVHLAAAKSIITKIDLDGPSLCSEDPVIGGCIFNNSKITLSDAPGFGIEGIKGLIDIKPIY
jgi:o-succinylbenzoate synthase